MAKEKRIDFETTTCAKCDSEEFEIGWVCDGGNPVVRCANCGAIVGTVRARKNSVCL